ncbi:uncharacterized protein LOC116253124 [Nymphaea colorata]|nr:uncharacterized protein LOC116253124 [Nymphaea colorata]
MSVGRFPHTYFRKFQINFPFLDEENARYGWNGEHRLLPQPPPSSLLLPSSQLPPPVLQLRGRPDDFGCRVGLQSSSPSLLQKGLVNKALRLSVFCKALFLSSSSSSRKALRFPPIADMLYPSGVLPSLVSVSVDRDKSITFADTLNSSSYVLPSAVAN